MGRKDCISFHADKTTVNAKLYVETLLPELVQDCISVLPPGFIFQQDGAPAHMTKLAQDCIATNCTEFIPNSPYLPCLGSYAWTLQVISTQAGEHRWAPESYAVDMGPAATGLHQQSQNFVRWGILILATLYVCPLTSWVSNTSVYCIKTSKLILKLFSPSGIHTICFSYQSSLQASDGDPLTGRRMHRGEGMKKSQPISRLISETIQDRAIVTMERQEKIAWQLLNGAISNDTGWHLTQVSRSRYYLMLNISEMVGLRDRDIVTIEY